MFILIKFINTTRYIAFVNDVNHLVSKHCKQKRLANRNPYQFADINVNFVIKKIPPSQVSHLHNLCNS